MLSQIARMGTAAPRRVIGFALILMVAIGIFGIPVAQHLSPSGFQDPTSESSRTAKVLTDKFGQGDVALPA